MIHIPDLVSANRESLAAKPADVVAGLGVEDVGGDGGVEGSVASSLSSPSSWQKLDRLVFSLTTVTNRRGGTAVGGGGGGVVEALEGTAGLPPVAFSRLLAEQRLVPVDTYICNAYMLNVALATVFIVQSKGWVFR